MRTVAEHDGASVIGSTSGLQHLIRLGESLNLIYCLSSGSSRTKRCDCGVYTIKFIECHSLGLKLSMVNDGNIKEARHRILWDLWEAANDPELVERMSNYEPPECLTSTVEEIL
uniref:Ubiquitin-like protease family profile domain-containing protein n=1 Tax=Brassica oleracea var. oleracea TaxID=109376 RepID=A0A0D3E7T1_BRAOL